MGFGICVSSVLKNNNTNFYCELQCIFCELSCAAALRFTVLHSSRYKQILYELPQKQFACLMINV